MADISKFFLLIKKFEKAVDKTFRRWYYNKAVAWKRNRVETNNLKNKKAVDKALNVWYDIKVARHKEATQKDIDN